MYSIIIIKTDDNRKLYVTRVDTKRNGDVIGVGICPHRRFAIRIVDDPTYLVHALGEQLHLDADYEEVSR